MCDDLVLIRQQYLRILCLDLFLQMGLCWTSSTSPPFITWVSRCAQSGRWSSFEKRVWFTESFFFFFFFFPLLVFFTQFILDKLNTGLLNQVKQTKSYFINLSPSLALLHSHLSCTQITPSTDANVHCPLLTYFPFKCLPILPLLPISNSSWTYVIIPCVTAASKLINVCTKWLATLCCIWQHKHFPYLWITVYINVYMLYLFSDQLNALWL
jgi:hypothetical protein